MSESSILSKIRDIDNRVIYAILIISLLIPYVRPLGLPIPISNDIEDYYEFITTVEEGSVVAIELASDPSTIPQLRSAHQISILKLLERNCKLVFFHMRDDAQPLHEEMMEWVLANFPTGDKPVYGEDWVNLGYLVDAESTVAALASGVKTLYLQMPMITTLTVYLCWKTLMMEATSILLYGTTVQEVSLPTCYDSGRRYMVHLL